MSLVAIFCVVALSLWLSGHLDDLRIFLYNNFVLPFGRYYTPVNTVVYGLILAVAILLLSRFLTLIHLEPNKKFIFSLIPYILIGSSARSLEDLAEYSTWHTSILPSYPQIFNSFFFISPIIYFTVFGYTFICLMFSLYLSRKRVCPFHILFFFLGLALLAYLTCLIVFVGGFRNIDGMLLVMEYAFFSILISVPIIVLVHRTVGFKTLSMAILIIGAHLIDASSTYVSTTYYGYIEEHPLPTLLGKIFGTTIVFIPMKFLALLFVMIVLDHLLGEENKQLSGVLKIALLTLGLAPGIRDLLRLGMGV
jgi:uncharacterized membrane protein